MARPRKPTASHVLHGTFRNDRHGINEPVFSGAPTHGRMLTGEALKMWKRIVPQLTAAGIATSADSAALVGLCSWFALWRRFDSLLQQGHGDGQTIYQAACAWKQFVGMASRFGLTPSDRTKLSVEPEQPRGVAQRSRNIERQFFGA